MYNTILKKMVKQDWMIPSSLIMLVIVATTNTEQCQIVLLNRCKAVYQEALRSSSKGEEGHCYRLQVWWVSFVSIFCKPKVSTFIHLNSSCSFVFFLCPSSVSFYFLHTIVTFCLPNFMRKSAHTAVIVKALFWKVLWIFCSHLHTSASWIWEEVA